MLRHLRSAIIPVLSLVIGLGGISFGLAGATLPLSPASSESELPEETAVPEEPVPPHCLYCGGALPAHRAVNFCPHCGQSQTVALCAHCHGELEPGWRHCVNCGATVGPA